ncbi:MAG: glycine cleavage system aminomethyltransferase GcvT [Pseudomonadota bacterium]
MAKSAAPDPSTTATDPSGSVPQTLRRTALFEAHKAAGARPVPFAGYEMPLQYSGIMAEHNATRESAGLFDVSHMGQMAVTGAGAADWLERLTPSSIANLPEGRARYSVLTNEAGGAVDDLIITRFADRFGLVVNGARKEVVADHFSAHAMAGVEFTFLDRALIALQGPKAEAVLQPHTAVDLAALSFMEAVQGEAFGVPATIARSGYTGEDGFELSLPNEAAPDAWRTLTADERVTPVGLGARDTLRLEAGLCLYGQDLDETISPLEAGLSFILPKRRREEGGFLGAERILREWADGPARRRIGLAVDGRVPVRAGAEVFLGEDRVGVVTSGGVGPTVGAPIAFALLERAAADAAEAGAALTARVRGKTIAVRPSPLPFVPARVKRKGNP